MTNIYIKSLFAFVGALCLTSPVCGEGFWGKAPQLPDDMTSDLTWLAAHAQAIRSDGWRESFAGTTPTLYKELETKIPKRFFAKMGIDPATTEPVVGLVPTEFEFPGPVGKQPTGILSGKIIYTNPGHGWTHDGDTGVWYTQRPLLFHIIEDLLNGDQMSIFADFCWRCGATVVPMRPVGHQPQERILDNTDELHVKWQGPWFDTKAGKQSLHFGHGDAAVPYRFALATKGDDSIVRYRPNFNREGLFPVYVWARDGEDRVPQIYRVAHRGGITEVTVDHRRVGKGWVWLGSFPFAPGDNGYVEITSKVDDAVLADGAHVVIADAVRFGNGVGDINHGDGISGYPREEECAMYWIERMLPANGWATHLSPGRDEGSANVGAPPRNSAYMNNEKNGGYFDRIFLGWHSNGLDREKNPIGRGATGLYCKSPEMCTDFQKEFGEECALVINDLLSSDTELGKILPVPYDRYTSLTFSQIDFGEIRRDYLGNEMCSTIVEVAFHDDEQDSHLLLSPFVRHLFARSMVQTIANFFASHSALGGDREILPPGAPDLLAARTVDSHAQVVFRPASRDEALRESKVTGYRLYSSNDGLGFNGGELITPDKLTPVMGLDGAYSITTDDTPKSDAIYYRLTALSAGGESRPSWTMGISEGKTTDTRICIGSVLPDPTRMNESDDLTLSQTLVRHMIDVTTPGGTVTRLAPELTQTGIENIRTAQALQALGVGFDTVALREGNLLDSSLYTGTVVSSGYRSKLPPNSDKVPEPAFVTGQNASADSVMCDADYVRGMNEAWPTFDLDKGKFGKQLYRDARGTVLHPNQGDTVLMYYDDDANLPALVKSGKEIIAGFPFEAVVSSSMREKLMKQVLTELEITDFKTPSPDAKAKAAKKAPAGKKKLTRVKVRAKKAAARGGARGVADSGKKRNKRK